MYGGASKEILNENSKFDPKSPYAASKVFAHEITKIYRDSYGIFGVNGILFNHESPLRGETFVTRKISRAVGRISVGLQEKLTLGNLDASRDWGYAKDYVNGMWMMMQHDTPDDWVLATGKTQTVREFAEAAFKCMVNYDSEEIINVGTGKDITIKELATTIADVVGFKGEIVWDTSKPNGTPRKVLNVDKIKSLGWEPKVGLREGIEKTYELYKESL